MPSRLPPVIPMPRATSSRVSNDIISALRADIASGRLPLGSRLPTETDLATHYGVSKPTVREAIRSLDTLGLIEVRHGSGAYIRADVDFLVMTALQTAMQLERTSIMDALAVREVLGRQSARWAAERHTDEDLVELEAVYEALEQMDFVHLDELIDAIAVFQERVTMSGSNALLITIERVLIRTLLQMQFKALRKRGLAFWGARAVSFQPDRRAIIDAIAHSDPDGAETAIMAYHAHQREVFEADPDLAQLIFSDPAALKVAEELSVETRRRNKG